MKVNDMNAPQDIKGRIEKLLSEILSDKYECKVTLRFERRDSNGEQA